MIALTTACFCLKDRVPGARSASELVAAAAPLADIDTPLVVYTDKACVDGLRRVREGRSSEFVVLEFDELWGAAFVEKVRTNRLSYHPTADARTGPETHCLNISKFWLCSLSMRENIFGCDRFGWVDAALLDSEGRVKVAEAYEPRLWRKAMAWDGGGLHVSILNANDKKYKLPEHKREYYASYPWVVCGSFFTFDREVGTRVLDRLQTLAVETIEAGYGHGEEPLFLEVLDEYYEDIVKSYGDYRHTLHNFAGVTRGVDYLYSVLVRYFRLGYVAEVVDLCRSLWAAYRDGDVSVCDEYLLDIARFYYVCCPTKGIEVIRALRQYPRLTGRV